jgi:hypothetical protein
MDDPKIRKLVERQDYLEKENTLLRKRVEELEKRLLHYEGPNSPSSAKPIYKKDPKSAKRSSGKAKKKSRKGRKKGHEGSTLVLQSDNEIHNYVSECSNCHEAVEQDAQRHIYSYQTVDLPEKISVDVTTHHVYETQCVGCDEFISSNKETLQGTIFGPKLASFFSLLFYKGRVPLRGISAILSALTELEFSASTVGNCLMTVADQLESPVDEITTKVLSSDQVHIDETGYISNITERDIGWIWSFSTPDEVFYKFRDSRGSGELKEIWSQDPGGTIAIVDGWKAYNFFPFKQRCWAHILRESRDLAVRRGGVLVAADERISSLFHSINRFKLLRPDSRNPIIWHNALIELEEISELISSDLRKDVRAFATKLANAKHDLLRAVYTPELPLTNNHAERCLRPLVIHRKIRGFVASERGKQTLMRMATMFETWNLRGDNPYDELLMILTAGS